MYMYSTDLSVSDVGVCVCAFFRECRIVGGFAIFFQADIIVFLLFVVT